MSGCGDSDENEGRDAEEQGDGQELRLAERSSAVGRRDRSGKSDTGEQENDSSIGVDV
ncbi:MAG TPA: hypothetical protein VMQ61_15570 [Thermoanaerobaculia bacterium]|nr:hypothetical protein [Thermoanaerobaculia bacterium]